MTELKKRLNSSMTWEEYVTYFEKEPKKPTLKPKLNPDLLIDPLDLLSDATTTDNFESFYPEVTDKLEQIQVLPFEQSQRRQRTYSENISFTFLSFIQKKIERKQSD
ncbi:unnamed protein product (macronuclear) [Paramecium tetraurelia]|uniref:Uncharacterized protein n=1 Tax=Paramecium tetraurelia TaxID=5888 RepID=A0DU82_PARTE|nr:uncharacterized protein GSPATT00020271001 [Paramecium tetraurelia]CAK86599.1 unnamed protein product [Paramecium tetraurelia]|eukprot:XP_001453996.1 hypothetical protein (macronuclear) [Paramecium tetraurelia strain d4-2]